MGYGRRKAGFMYLKFLSLRVKNFLSYGNNITEFNFENGLSLISAKNGSGKSSIGPEALSYVLFGKPYRDIKVSELVNRKNKKGLYTEIEFMVESDKYKIIRTISPNKLEMYKNEVAVDSLSSKALNQEEINKILGVDHKLFKTIIALSVNYNKPFLSLGVTEKREMLESVFDIRVFAEMLSKLKKETSLKKSEKLSLDTQMKTLEGSILAMKKQITQIKESIKTFDQDKEDEIIALTSKLESLETKKASILQEINTIEESKNEIVLDEEDYSSKITEVSSVIAVDENKVKDLNKQSKFIKNNTVCPLCSHELDEEHKSKEEEKIKKELEKLTKRIEKNKKSLETLSTKLTKQKTTNNNLRELTNKLFQLNNNIGLNNNNIENTNEEIEKVKNKKFNFDTTNLETTYNEQIEEYKEISKLSNDIKEELVVSEYASKMLADDGIKTYFFKRLVPILNKKINEYLEMFEIPIKIDFDEKLYEKIAIIGTSEKNVSYFTFSEGERKRIDVAILLSFIETTKIVCNWNCNLLYFDEVLDNATDADGLEKLLLAIKELGIKDERLCTYVISHREHQSELFDRKIQIKKIAGFSQLEKK